MFPRRLSILGVGLLGGSLGLAVRSLATGCQITGYTHNRRTGEQALQANAVDRFVEDPAAAIREADLVVLCTPVSLFPSLLEQIAPHLAPGVIVTDVASTKASIVAAAQRLLPPHVPFVGSHPMAGSEKRGIEFARADLFQNALCILTPTSLTNAAALAQVESFWRRLGMRTTKLSADDHDRLIAQISHVPHAVAAALVSIASDAALPLAGKGFVDTTRIASGDASLWRDILLDNANNVRAGLRQLRTVLDELDQQLDCKDGDAIQKWLENAAQRRRATTMHMSGAFPSPGPATPAEASGIGDCPRPG
jgi:prephenate dehydrogenase